MTSSDMVLGRARTATHNPFPYVSDVQFPAGGEDGRTNDQFVPSAEDMTALKVPVLSPTAVHRPFP